MTFGNQPKLDIPPIAKSPTYTAPTVAQSSGSNKAPNATASNASGNQVHPATHPATGKSPGSATNQNQSPASSYSSNASKNTGNATSGSSSSSRYHGSKSTPESIYQQQQKRPNTIQHPPASMAGHLDARHEPRHNPDARHNPVVSSQNNFFPVGFPPSASSLSSMPLRHLPEATSRGDVTTRSPYDYAAMPHHAMGFTHHHGYAAAAMAAQPPSSSFSQRDCSRAEPTHHQHQQQQQTQQTQQQAQQQQHAGQQQSGPSPRKQSTAKKNSASSGSLQGSSSSNSSSNSRANSSSNNNTSALSHSHPATSSSGSRIAPPSHHSANTNSSNSRSSSGATTSSSSSSSLQKRKAASSSSSSSSRSKKTTASQHTGFPSVSEMDTGMSTQSMFEPSFPYLNFPTLTQSMSPPAARPHQSETPFLGGMFNTAGSVRSNSSSKAAADMTAGHFNLFHRSHAQNSFFQPPGFGMNSMTGNHGNPTAGISPHSMAMPPHMSPFGLFGNEAPPTDNISSNKFLHANSILPNPHQAMEPALQHGAAQASLYHNRPHSATAQSHMMPMAALYPHGFDSRGHMGQAFNSSMGPPPFHTHGLPPINFSMHDTH